jgi:arabinogalactan endo-1,4-beta-galactosidase
MRTFLFISVLVLFLFSCKRTTENNPPAVTRTFYSADQFVMGADLSYVNQIIDFGGYYQDSGKVENAYLIFRRNGANVIRFRLFNNPTWTKEIYGAAGTQMYNDYYDVKRGIAKAKSYGLKVCLDFHYSDSWADPSKQVPPAAWQSLSLTDLHDSLYNYTYKTLHNLDIAGLMPEYVQVGNEINPGFLLPQGDRWNGNEDNFIYLINSAIKGVRDAGSLSAIKPKIIIHIAQPENVHDWFAGLSEKGLTDYDIIGFSYYYMYSDIKIGSISDNVYSFKQTFNKEIMIMETAYPWTTGNADSYSNIINTSKILSGYPATETGQYKYLHLLTQEVITGGGKGIFTWEPAWITSDMKDPWGTGSSWDCNTLFDFHGKTLDGILFMTDEYNFPVK